MKTKKTKTLHPAKIILNIIKFLINLDKLELIFNLPDMICFTDLLKDSKHFIYTPPTTDLYYLECFKILDIDRNPLCIIKHRLKTNPEYNKVIFFNEALYRPDLNVILFNLVNDYRLENIRVDKIDLSVDTNEPLLKRFSRLYKANSITLQKNYVANNFGSLEDNKIEDSIYLKPIEDSRYSKKPIVRLYNKTKEILINNNKKSYLVDNYLLNGLDIEKQIYRIEVSLFEESFRFKNMVFEKEVIENPDDIFLGSTIETKTISKYIYDKLSATDKEGWIKKYKNESLDITIENLTDKDYLIELFRKYIVFDIDLLIELQTTKKTKLNMKTFIKGTKQISNNRAENERFIIEQQIKLIEYKIKEAEKIEDMKSKLSMLKDLQNQNNNGLVEAIDWFSDYTFTDFGNVF